VLKTVIFLFQVGFTGDFVPDCISNCVSGNSNFDTAFLPDCTTFCSTFWCYWIGHLMRILKMCLKQSLSHFKWVLQVTLSLTVIQTVFLAVQTLIPLFSETLPNFVVFFFAI